MMTLHCCGSACNRHQFFIHDYYVVCQLICEGDYFLAVFVAVPLQFLLSPSSSSDLKYHLHKLKNSLSRFSRLFLYKDEKVDEVIDVPENEKETKYFGSSLEPRDPRPPYVKYRVGDVIRHKVHGYRGVIIGWDEKQLHRKVGSIKRIKEWSEMPNYSVIIDTRDRLIPQLAYVVEENIELGEGRVFHPLIKNYFEAFDGKHYSSRPWHKKVYPND
ncbi:Hemimethylated DNA binding domain protein [Dirofilaria immitis]|nr:Hemimethylated DNA binding domain protein [Dirofilaria immitis]